MKLISVKGRNIGLLKGEFEFNFDDSLTVITGPIGCGKSTILTLIRASLTNSFPGNAGSWASWGVMPQEACYFVVTWRVGNNVLHIAKCVAGEKQFATLNIPRLLIEADSGEVETITSSKEALEKTLGLITVPANIIDGHLIVDQDSITAPVASTPARFKEIIHTLTRTNELEVLRGRVRDILMSVVVPDVQPELDAAQIECNVQLGEVNKNVELIEKLLKDATAINVEETHYKLDTLELVKRNTEKRKLLNDEVVIATAALEQLIKAVLKDQMLAVALEENIKTLEPEIAGAKTLVYSADSIIKDNLRLAKLRQQVKETTLALNQFTDNPLQSPELEQPTEADLKELEESLNNVKQELHVLKKRLELALAGNCPECGTSTCICPKDLAAMNSEVTKLDLLKAEYSSLLVKAKNGIVSWTKYETEAKNWVHSVTALSSKLDAFAVELELLKDTPYLDEAIKQNSVKMLESYEASTNYMLRVKNDVAAKTGHLENQKIHVATKQAALAEIPPAVFDPNEHAKCTKLLDDHLAIRMQLAATEGALTVAHKGLTRANERLVTQTQRKATIKPIESLRTILNLASSVLVKDGLPKLLSLQYMGKLNERIKFYLNMINADFSAYIDENLEFMAKKADGLVHRTGRLSGGQKQQASVAYLLAVNDVFASTLGVLALDEPSGAMQEGNSQELAEAFSYLAKVGQQTGRQFIIITHSAALAAYGCTKIELQGN